MPGTKAPICFLGEQLLKAEHNEPCKYENVLENDSDTVCILEYLGRDAISMAPGMQCCLVGHPLCSRQKYLNDYHRQN